MTKLGQLQTIKRRTERLVPLNPIVTFGVPATD